MPLQPMIDRRNMGCVCWGGKGGRAGGEGGRGRRRRTHGGGGVEMTAFHEQVRVFEEQVEGRAAVVEGGVWGVEPPPL